MWHQTKKVRWRAKAVDQFPGSLVDKGPKNQTNGFDPLQEMVETHGINVQPNPAQFLTNGCFIESRPLSR